MYSFEHISYLWWLLSIIGFALLFLMYFSRRNRKLKRFFTEKNLALSLPDYSHLKTLTKFVIMSIGLGGLIMVMTNPLAGKRVDRQVSSKGSDVQFVVDISNSMMAEDIDPSRLEKSKQIMLQLIDRLGSDRVGIVLFAGDAFIQLPMTIDHSAAVMFIRNIETDLIDPQGTDIEKALELSLESIDSSKAIHPAVVLFSDGENFEGNPNKIISTYKERNIPIHTIALGTENGSPIPIYSRGVKTGYKKDKGEVVVSRPDLDFLKDLAKQSGGVFVDYEDISYAPQIIADALANMDKEETGSIMFSDYRSLYLWILLPVFLLLILEFFLIEKRMKWQNQLRNFVERRKI